MQMPALVFGHWLPQTQQVCAKNGCTCLATRIKMCKIFYSIIMKQFDKQTHLLKAEYIYIYIFYNMGNVSSCMSTLLLFYTEFTAALL